MTFDSILTRQKKPGAAALLAAALCVAGAMGQTATAQPHGSGYVQVVVGATHSCALRHDGEVWCWGANTFGQLGIGNQPSSVVPVQAYSDAQGFRSNNIASIGAHYYANCALNTAGRAFCWGSNSYGELGDGSTTARRNPVPVNRLRAGLQSLSTGTYSTCAIDANNRSWCWGRNSEGQVGDNTNIQRTIPRPVNISTQGFGPRNIAEVRAGGNHACAINAAGRAYCWGRNIYGQLGTGGGGDSLIPVGVSVATAGFGRRNIAQVAVGVDHSCALNRAGRVFCWGRNTNGQLGLGIPNNPGSPVPIATDTSAPGFAPRNTARIVAGAFTNCALNTNGRAYCWGRNGSGQVGDGTSGNDRNAPVQVSGLGAGLRDIATKLNHSCAIDAAGDVWCWGQNSSGQLGDGTTTDSPVPVRVQGLP